MATMLTSSSVLDVDFTNGLTLIEIAKGVSVSEFILKTEAPFRVVDDLNLML